MSQASDHYYVRTKPGQERDLVAMSNALALAPGCEQLACRRAGRCRGFADKNAPRCLPRVCERLEACFQFYAAPLPTVPGRELTLYDKLKHQLLRIADARLDREEEERAARTRRKRKQAQRGTR